MVRIEQEYITPPANSMMFYFPIGPKTLLKKFPNMPKNWLYYKIDIHSGQYSPLNKQPFTVYKTNRDCRYPHYKLFFLNVHGGYDYVVFDKKNQIKYKLKRSSYNQRLLPGYDFRQSGELVYNVDVNQEITLTTSYLHNQKESQIITQLTQSPVVFLVQTYNINSGYIATTDDNGPPSPNLPTYMINQTVEIPYSVPYIIASEEVKYEQIINDKMVLYEITIRPANKKIIQNL